MTLKTKTGKAVPELVLHASQLLEKTLVMYGPAHTGKTVLTKTIMSQLQGHIDQIIMVAPTEPSNHSYDGYVDPTLIHYRMHLADPEDRRDSPQKAALRFLNTVYQRQEMAASIYAKANKIETLSSLYKRLTEVERKVGDHYIASLENKRRRVVASVNTQFAKDLGRRDEKVKEVNSKFKTMLALIYKKFLTPCVPRLRELSDLSEEERCSLHYIHFNPRLLLIFDDCAAELKPFFNKDIFRKLFYQNRHVFITLIMCCQDDTDLPTNLRKNAFISFFTESVVCSSNFERTSNKYPKSVKDYVANINDDVFSSRMRKMAYIRDDPRRQHFYHITCPHPKPFMFGSPAVLELCAAVRSEGGTMDKNNPFYEKFRVE